MKKNFIGNARVVDFLQYTLGFSGGELVKQASTIRNIFYVTPNNDLNFINNHVQSGIHIFNFNPDVLNNPANSHGMILHLQRAQAETSTNSQMITQIAQTTAGLYIRTAMGSGAGIQFKPWKLIEL